MSSTDRRVFMAGALATGSAASLGVAAPAKGVTRPAAVQALVSRERQVILEAMARAGIEGAAVCFIHQGETVWIEGLGVLDRRSGRPVTTDTIFSIQSTSKNLTAAAILIAVQEGLLDLDEPISAYLPGFTVNSRFEPAPERRMSLRLLLSHRSGFTHEAPVGNNYDPVFPDFESHVRSISQTWLRYPVGERYRYSNLGYDLAGWILQVRSGMPFAEWMRTRLFDPLGMADSTVASDVYERRVNRALGHDKGHLTVPLRTPLIPSGGVYTSARDMAAYARFLLNHGAVGRRTVLRRDLWDQMHGFALGGDYGLGVIRTERRYGDTALRLLGHKGGGFGFGSVFDYCPDAGLAWAALFNRPADLAYGFGRDLVAAALTRRYGARRPRLPVEALAPIQPTTAQLDRLVGNWVARNEAVELQICDGALQILQGGATTPLAFGTPDEILHVTADGETRVYRYYAGVGDEPAHLECSEGEVSLDYNDGPHDPAGPDDPAWERFVGRYRLRQWGVIAQTLSIQRRNGWLYLDDTRLIGAPQSGLFFTSDGEAVDFRSHPPTWKNLKLEAAVSIAPALPGFIDGFDLSAHDLHASNWSRGFRSRFRNEQEMGATA